MPVDGSSVASGAAIKKDFNVEYAKSGRSTCRGCEEKIAKVIYAVAMVMHSVTYLCCVRVAKADMLQDLKHCPLAMICKGVCILFLYLFVVVQLYYTGSITVNFQYIMRVFSFNF